MKRLMALLAACLAAATVTSSASGAAAAGRGEELLRHSVLRLHNDARAQFGVRALIWSEQLAASATRHALYMSSTGLYGHDRTPGRRKLIGENIWRGQRGHFSYDVMVTAMLAESRNFRPGAFPRVSRTGNWQDVGHFTQIVWPTTTHVGCALASSATTDYFVCRYSPAGNKDGVFLSAAGGKLAEGGN